MKDKLMKLSQEKGFLSLYKLTDVDESYYYLWMMQIHKWLREVHNCYIKIVPEAYTTGINFNWQVLFYDPTDIDCWSDTSTGLYGDNGEFPTYELALEAALLKSLTLFDMKDLEKQIEEFSYTNSTTYSEREAIVIGIKSEVAKEYHTQNMYTEEEVLTIISKLDEFDSMSSSWLSAWFKKNKKK